MTTQDYGRLYYRRYGSYCRWFAFRKLYLIRGVGGICGRLCSSKQDTRFLGRKDPAVFYINTTLYVTVVILFFRREACAAPADKNAQQEGILLLIAHPSPSSLA